MFQYLKYLQYIPLLVQLIAFIRTAEKRYREAGTGAEKAQWVQSQFSALVDTAESTGLIGKKFADVLREYSLGLISIFVQAMKDKGGAILEEGESDAVTATLDAGSDATAV